MHRRMGLPLAALACFAALAIPSHAAHEMVFIGVSRTEVAASAGVLAMAQSCRQDFGEDARMATTDEVFESPAEAPHNNVGAWVQFNPALAIVNPLDGHTVLQDKHGMEITLSVGIRRNCGGWRFADPDGQAIAVTRGGGLFVVNCAAPRLVACSVPRESKIK